MRKLALASRPVDHSCCKCNSSPVATPAGGRARSAEFFFYLFFFSPLITVSLRQRRGCVLRCDCTIKDRLCRFLVCQLVGEVLCVDDYKRIQSVPLATPCTTPFLPSLSLLEQVPLSSFPSITELSDIRLHFISISAFLAHRFL